MANQVASIILNQEVNNMKSQVKELFIYNETYPLPPEKYLEFKTRLSFCTDNPMCVSRVKGDAESFIADWGKKHGSKLENGEESGFFFMKEDTDSPAVKKLTDIKEKKSGISIVIIIAIIVLAILAVTKKNMTLGILTIGLIMILLSI